MSFKIKQAVLKVRQILCLQEAAHYGSLSKAAAQNGMKQSNFSIQIKELEDSLGTNLLTRVHDGIRLTEAGKELYALSCDLTTTLNKIDTAKLKSFHVAGGIRFWTSDGLAAAYISDCFSDFYTAYPNVRIDLICSLEMPKLEQFDMAVVYEKPTGSRLKIISEHELNFGLFASKSYLEKYGCPRNLADLAQKHRLCSRSNYPSVWPKWEEILQQAASLAAVTNSSGMLLQLIKDGIGIGLLPVGLAAQDPQLVRLPRIKTRFRHKFWLVVRNDVRDMDKIKALIRFIENESDQL